MARVKTRSVANMGADAVPTGTRWLFDIRSKEHVLDDVEAWERYQAYLSAPEGFPEPISPVPFAKVADAEAVRLGERFFVKMRLRAEDSDDPGGLHDENGEWKQVNATNFSALNIQALKAACKAIYDAEQVSMGLAPEA